MDSDEDFDTNKVDLNYDEADELAEDAEKHYTILKDETIRQLQDNNISEVSNILSLSRGLACTLLLQNKWSVSSILEEWFTDEETARHSIGISSKHESPPQPNKCNICFENITIKNMLSGPCGHPFCLDCLKTYISVSINDGPGCLILRCPEPNCRANLGFELVDLLASADEQDKYYRYLSRSYVEGNKNRKWCPAPGCNFAVEFDSGGGGETTFDVTCDCSFKFCWNCAEECHRPVGCDTVAKWMEKNRSEAENTTWIIAYTKPCPKCRRPIEKNQGCNHMTCGQPCWHRFCWMCLKSLEDHSSCNRYKADQGDEKKKQMDVRKHLRRYTHYYERWNSNDKSRKRALDDLNRVRNVDIDKLSRVQEVHSQGQLKFVVEAWDQLVECRRVLKWTYAYGYFLSGSETRKEFFGFLQGEAEGVLERLHHCAEKEMKKYLKRARPFEDFKDFRTKLCRLTGTTRNYFENLVRALENDLCEVTAGTSKKSKTESSKVDRSNVKKRRGL